MNLKHKLQRSMQLSSKEELETTFNDIFNQFYKLIYFVSLQYVKNDADAEDITQDVFLLFFNKLAAHEINKIKNIKSYLCIMAKNKSLDLLKNKAYQNLEFDNDIVGSKDQYQFFDETFIRTWQDSLNKEEQDIIINKILLELSFKDIASEFKKNVNTIKTTYTRAIKKLRERMKDYE